MPFLQRRHPKPIRRAVLVVVVDGMARGEVARIVPVRQQRARGVRPRCIAETVQVIAQFPGDIGKSAQPRDSVPIIAPLVRAARRRMFFAVVPIQDDGNDNIPVPGVAQHPLELGPVSEVKARKVETGVDAVGRALGGPGIHVKMKAVTALHGFGREMLGGAAIEENPDTVDFPAMIPVEHVANDLVILPAHKQEGGGSVPEIMFARPGPDKMPRISRVNAQRAAPSASRSFEGATEGLKEAALLEMHRVSVVSRAGGHEAQAVEAAIGRVAEPGQFGRMGIIGLAKLAPHSDIRKGIRGVGITHLQRKLDEIPRVYPGI